MAGACLFKGPVSELRRPRRRDVLGPPRPEAARFLPGGATAPEQLRRRRLGAGGPFCSAGAVASSRSPFLAAHGKGEQAASGTGAGLRGRGGRAAPASGSQGGREGRAGRGARPRGPYAARRSRPPGRPRATGHRRRAPARHSAAGGLQGSLGLAGPLRARPQLCRGAFERGRGLPGGHLPRARSAGEGPGVTEAPIFSRA